MHDLQYEIGYDIGFRTPAPPDISQICGSDSVESLKFSVLNFECSMSKKFNKIKCKLFESVVSLVSFTN